MLINQNQNYQNENTVERALITSNIEMFNDKTIYPEFNIKNNLMDAFPFRRTGLKGQGSYLFSGQNLSGGLASVVSKNQTNNNTLSTNLFNTAIPMFNLGYDLPMDVNSINDGKLDVASTISKASKLLNYQGLYLMLNGEAMDGEKKNKLMLVENNLYDCGTAGAGVNVGASTTTVNAVNAMFEDMASGIIDAGFNPEVLLLSRKAYMKIFNLKKDMGQDGVFAFLKATLNLDIYVSDFFDNVRGGGATAIMTTRDEAGLQSVIGSEAFLPHGGNYYINSQNRIYTLNITVGGFATINKNKNIVQIRNKLLG
jgi:hypothetical protein